ncbi:hypothetical protein BDZ91DRAFT_710000 [Kalaharituber pfeilii]|nr:hypothetical protein BDZ91DRAFT_710000 [Kalaharituber pfeilii]
MAAVLESILGTILIAFIPMQIAILAIISTTILTAMQQQFFQQSRLAVSIVISEDILTKISVAALQQPF